MLKKTTQLLLPILCSFQILAQCPSEMVFLTTQAEVDNFATTYSGCPNIGYFVGISGPDIVDLSALNFITSIGSSSANGGLAIVDNPLLTNLNGLQNLQNVIDGNIEIRNNALLSSIEALSGLSGNLDGYTIEVKDNPSLTSLMGLHNIVQAGDDDIVIWNNDLLTDLTGLDSMTVADDVLIWDNDGLISLNGFGSFEFTGTFSIKDNELLASLDGLQSLNTTYFLELSDNPNLNAIDSVEDVFFEVGVMGVTIVDNPSLMACSLSNICLFLQNGGDATISNNASGCNSVPDVLSNCSTCPSEAIVLSSQAEVDAFASNYPGCTTLGFTLTISGNDITDLSGLAQIEEISSGGLIISDNPSLTTTAGMGPIDFSGSFPTFNLFNNDLLESIASFEGSTLVDGSLFLDNNPSLSSIAALSGFTGRVDVEIYNCDLLSDLTGLSGITETPTLSIGNNASLEDISALGGSGGTTDFLYINDNPMLSSLDGLQGYTTARFDLFIENLPLITNLDPLSGMNNINSELETSVIKVTGNNALVDISGLANIDPDYVFFFEFQNNPQLGECSILSVCNALTNGVVVTVSNNAPGCNTTTEISEECSLGTTEFDLKSSIGISPNPTTGYIEIILETGISLESFEVFTVQGKKVWQGNNQVADVSPLPSGMYFVKISSDRGSIIKKLIKK